MQAPERTATRGRPEQSKTAREPPPAMRRAAL
jgi:hypothetical protein